MRKILAFLHDLFKQFSFIRLKQNFKFLLQTRTAILLLKLLLLIFFTAFTGIVDIKTFCESIHEIVSNEDSPTSQVESTSKEGEQTSKWKKYHIIGTLITMGFLISWIVYKVYNLGDNTSISDSEFTSSDSESTSSNSESESSASGSPSAKDNTETQNTKKETLNEEKKEDQPRSSTPREEFSQEEQLLIAKLDRYGQAIVDNFHDTIKAKDVVGLYNLGRDMGVTFDVNNCSYVSLGFLTLSSTEGTYNESVVRALGTILYCCNNNIDVQSIYTDLHFFYNNHGSYFLHVIHQIKARNLS